jgi:predicted nucleotidyltransferase
MGHSAFPTPILDQKLAQQRYQWERDRQVLLSAAQEWLELHAQEFGIEQGYLLGSVTQAGRFSARSDIDIAVETFCQGEPFGLASYLSLHLNRDVDVLSLDQCHFAEKIRKTGLSWSTQGLLDSKPN